MTKFSDSVAHKHFLVGQMSGSGLSRAQCTCGLPMSSNGAYAIHLAETVAAEAYEALQDGIRESLLSGSQRGAMERSRLVAFRLLIKDLEWEDVFNGLEKWESLSD